LILELHPKTETSVVEVKRRPITAADGMPAEMYEAYFTKRLLKALSLAEEAKDAQERSVHLRTSRYYRDLLEHPDKRRVFRHSTRIRATLHHLGTHPRRVIVSDLSTCGFRVELEERAKPGTVIMLEIGGLSPLDAYVVWQEDEQVGCKFLNELHPALVEAALAVSSRI
jgi:hypothetical protein